MPETSSRDTRGLNAAKGAPGIKAFRVSDRALGAPWARTGAAWSVRASLATWQASAVTQADE